MIQKIFLILFIGIFLPFSQPNTAIQNDPIILNDQIESAFVFFGDKPFYGLNINTTPGEVRFNIVKSGAYRLFLIESDQGDQTITLAGMNNAGRFIAGQTIISDSEPENNIAYNNAFILNFLTNDNITDIKQWLITQENINQLSGKKFILSAPSLKAGVVEITESTFDFYPAENGFQILLPLPNKILKNKQTQDPIEQNYQAINRFLTLEILENINNPNLNTHFSMAHQVKNNPSDSISLIISPTQNEIFITMNNDPTKIWMINLDGGTIETYQGFEQLHKGNLPDIGITSKDLYILNFSNESLMVGIIFATSTILMIIGLTVFFNLRKRSINN